MEIPQRPIFPKPSAVRISAAFPRYSTGTLQSVSVFRSLFHGTMNVTQENNEYDH
jgi:hypothetical protein